MVRKMIYGVVVLLFGFSMTGCGNRTQNTELTVLAAASLTDVCGEIQEMYEQKNDVTLHFSFGGSGALQSQIEEGTPCDIFMPASHKQMMALQEQGLMEEDSVQNLLENKVVLITSSKSTLQLSSFEDVLQQDVKMIGIGEIGSVPVGQYAEEIFASLGIIDEIKAKANYGSDVRTVLTWVETEAVDCGVVYATDANTSENVRIICDAPEGSCGAVVYPVGVTSSSKNKKEAADFIAFLQTDEVKRIFEKYGFTPMK